MSSISKHTDHKCDHQENRLKVCAPCGSKINFGKQKPERFRINSKHEDLIRTHINGDFKSSDPKFPLGICGSCRLTLFEREKGNPTRPLQIMPNYEEINLPKETRLKGDICNCYICLTGQHKGYLKIQKGRGHVRNTSNFMDVVFLINYQ